MNTFFWLSYVALWILTGSIVVILISLMKAVSKGILGKQETSGQVLAGPDLGSELPDFRAVDSYGGREVKKDDLRGKPTFLFFFHPECSGCHQVVPHVNEVHRLRPSVGMYVFSRASREENVEFIKNKDLVAPVLVDVGGRISQSMNVNHTPFAVLLNAEGVVVHRFAMVGTQFDDLVRFIDTFCPTAA